jgi:hypothetical protein
MCLRLGLALDPKSDTRNGFVGRLRALPDLLGGSGLRLNNDPASQRRRHLSICRTAAMRQTIMRRALMEVLGKADFEQASERSGKLDEIS